MATKRPNNNKRQQETKQQPSTGRRRKALPAVRYAVVGLGHIAQAAVLPAFKHTKRAQLAALISDDSKKLKKLGRTYGVKAQYEYQQLETCIRDEGIEAVYIALPNSMHREYTERSAAAGAHVLCEKPLAVSTAEAQSMIDACRRSDVLLMTAYRLHFDKANLEAIDSVIKGRIGDPLVFSSTFSYQVESRNIRLERELGGGALFDIGIYCINAARYLFRSEPLAVSGQLIFGQDERFSDVEGTCSAHMIFPEGRVAQFTCSFCAANSAAYDLIGSKGSIRLDPAYEYQEPLEMELRIRDKSKRKKFKRSDQFAAEIEYFAECIREGNQPEPDGFEGLADLRVIEAIRESARTGTIVTLGEFNSGQLPQPEQAREAPASDSEPPMVHVQPPHTS